MHVEFVQLEQGRPVTDLAENVERQGGALVVLKWQPGAPTLVSVHLPEDHIRRATCRRLLADWRSIPADRREVGRDSASQAPGPECIPAGFAEASESPELE